MPSVSIVLPTRNRASELCQALDSVARQTHLELELVLVRDGGASLDEDARARIEALEFPAQVLEHDDPPGGLAASRDRGIRAARGDAIALLDDDDLWSPEHIAKLADALGRDPGIDVAYSDAWVVNDGSEERRMLALDFDLDIFSRDSFIPPSAMIARKDAFERFGLFDASLPYSEDWDWLLRVALAKGVIVRAPGPTATIRIHPGGMSQLLDSARVAERQRSLDLLSSRYGLPRIEPKTFWEVAGELCPQASDSTP